VANSHDPLLHTITLRDPRAGDRSYVVKAACSARRTTTVLDYVLLDAGASSASESEAERTISSGALPCDGTPIADSAGPLGHGPVTVDFRAVPEDISQAYAVVVPE
jgi:hypothetical protein